MLISQQVFSFILSFSTTSGRFASIVRYVITGTSHIAYKRYRWHLRHFQFTFVLLVSNLELHMFAYRPVDLASHLIVSISVSFSSYYYYHHHHRRRRRRHT